MHWKERREAICFRKINNRRLMCISIFRIILCIFHCQGLISGCCVSKIAWIIVGKYRRIWSSRENSRKLFCYSNLTALGFRNLILCNYKFLLFEGELQDVKAINFHKMPFNAIKKEYVRWIALKVYMALNLKNYLR